MDFVAVDVETANADMASICQIGVIVFQAGVEVSCWHSLVNPEDEFDFWNVQLHGIDADAVADAPTWPTLYPQVASLLRHKIVVCHMPFDRVATTKVCSRYSLAEIDCAWLDAARVVRRTWPQFAKSGYSLTNIAEFLGIQFLHHDAVEDARTAGKILVSAIETSGCSLSDWLKRAYTPISGSRTQSSQSGNPDGPLFGETIVFTGALSLTRSEAAKLAAEVGCTVADSVTQATTMLVVGNQDIRKLVGQEKSTKHRKAEKLQFLGHNLRIMTEDDFLQLIGIFSLHSSLDKKAVG